MRRAIVGACISLAATVSSVHGQSNVSADLNALDAQGSRKELFRRLMGFEPFRRLPDPAAAAEIGQTLNWLRDRGFFQNESSRYTYAYSAWLWQAGFRDTSAAMYFFAGIKARSDGVRCADKTSAPDQVRQYEQLLGGPIRQFLQTQDKATKEKIYKLATTRLEERLPVRKPDEWLCNGGLQFFQKYAEKHGNLSGREIQTASGMLPGRSVVLEDDSIKPEFISDAAWRTERRATTDAALASLRKLLLE